MIEILIVLGMPLAGALLLAVIGERDEAPVVNVIVCGLTLLAAGALTVRVISTGPLLVAGKLFFVDPFNVFLVALTAFVASRPRSSPSRTCGSSASTAASPPSGCGSITACISCSTSRCCWRCSPTT